MKYFPLRYRLHAEKRYLIWISNEKDSVAVDPQGFVPSFPSLGLLRQHAGLNHYTLESDEPRLLDLDWVVRWRRAPITPVDCEKALGAWNLFTDVAASIPRQRSVFEELKSQFFPIYDKLFWGNNLPAVTPRGKRYDPEWTRARDEIDSSNTERGFGPLHLLRSRLRNSAALTHQRRAADLETKSALRIATSLYP